MTQTTAERIRASAITLFARNGYAATGIRDIAEGAQVRSAALYHHFGNKEDVLLAIVQDINRQLLDAANMAIARAERAEDRLGALVIVHTLGHALNPEGAIVADLEIRGLTGDAREQILALRSTYEELWRSAIADGIKEKVFNTIDPAIARLALLQMCTGVAHWYRDDGRVSPTDLALSFVELTLSALNAQREGQRLSMHDLKLPDPAWFVPIMQAAGIAARTDR